MPSKSKAQHNMFEMVLHNPKQARKLGIPQQVAKEYIEADKQRGKAALRKLPRKKT